MDQGKLIRKLRKERNLTQEQLAAGISPRTTLASFEQNNSKLDVQILLAYLRKMHIPLKAYYQMVADPALLKSDAILNKYYTMLNYSYKDEEADKVQQLYQENHDFAYYALYATMIILGKRFGAYQNVALEPIATTLKNYLNNIETWGEFEVQIFTNCLEIFEEDYILLKFKRVVRKLELYTETINFNRNLQIFFKKVIEFFFERRNFELTDYFLTELQHKLQHSRSDILKLWLDTYQLVLTWDHNPDDEKRAQLLLVLNYFDEKFLADFLQIHTSSSAK